MSRDVDFLQKYGEMMFLLLLHVFLPLTSLSGEKWEMG